MATQQSGNATNASVKGSEYPTPIGTFEHISAHEISTLDVVLHTYHHKKTGARHFHIQSDSTEHAFMVAFKTVPTDSTGIAHILEHTTLCGSQKYPVRDPFFMMLRRSLSTFMNAFTSSDWTAYPFATQSRKDFFNLLSVYLDATFFPNLNPLDFAQEGHRLEFSEPTNPESELVYKGVVFNEMKGAMSAINSILFKKISHHLYPSVTYHFNSGGDPKVIPDLTYEQLVAFHKKHYHPSNADFFTFGSLPVDELQTQFEDNVLSHFDALDEPIEVALEPANQSPTKVIEYYGIDEQQTAQKTYHALAWQVGEGTDAQARMEAMLLSNVLLLNSASPLRHMLETYPHGTAPLSISGLDSSKRQMSFTCGVEGSEAQYAEHLESAVFEVLRTIEKEGIEHDMLESICHQLELHQREITGGSMPYGLQLMLATLDSALHGGDPSALLDLDPALVQLRKDIQDPDYIKRLVKKLLLDNKHYVRLTVCPDTELNAREKAWEAEKLKSLKSTLSQAQIQSILNTTDELKIRQAQKDDPDVLPRVTLADVPEEVPYHSPDHTSDEASLNIAIGENQFTVPKVTQYRAGTNGISYVDTLFALPHLTGEDMETLTLLKNCMASLGVGQDDYRTMQKRQSQITAGIKMISDLRVPIDAIEPVIGYASISSKALDRNLEPMVNLLDETLQHLRFDETQRIRELVAQMRGAYERSVTNQGHSLAIDAAASTISSVAHLNHHYSYGLEQIKKLKALDDSLNDEAALQALAQRLQTFHQKLLQQPRARLVISDLESWPELEQLLKLPGSASAAMTPLNYAAPAKPQHQAWITNTQVNFCAKVFKTVAPNHKDSAALKVLGSFLRDGFLHRAIREEGGAYGGGASHRASGHFIFYSYRDPRLMETQADFDNAVRWMLENTHEERALEEAILGVVSSLDKPGSPAGEAYSSFYNMLHNRSKETLRKVRENVLNTTLEDLKRVAEQYLLTDNNDQHAMAVVTNATNLEECPEKDIFEVHTL